MAAAGGPVVVKLGGSFAFSPHLRAWIEALAACGGHAVIVPGGGPFADTVRDAQTKVGFDDKAAHAMALLAMEQYGLALASLDGRLVPAASLDAIDGALERGRVPVWLPARLALEATDIAPSWDTTSDSLAAWLAGKIGARRLFLVKHVELQGRRVRADELVSAGVVDKEFVRHLLTCAAAAFILGACDHAAGTAAIRNGAAAGIAVE